MPDPQTHYRTCNLCEAMCGLEIQYQDKEILSIRGDEKDPFSKGHICPKAVALKDIYEDKDRLKYPIRKTATGWERISWEKAFDYVVENIRAVQVKHGNNAVGIYAGNPNVHNLGSMLYLSPFIKALKTKNRFSATSADQLPHHFASLMMFGHYFMIPVPDVDRTDFMLILGANPLVSNGSLMTAAGIHKRLRAIRKRGGKVVVIDPRRTETADKADQHLSIQPGTDALLLAALIHVIFEEGLENPGRLAAFTDGFEDIRLLVRSFTPAQVAPICGIPPETIQQLARDFAAAEKAVCYGRMGVSVQAFGGVCQWLINVINIITGNFDREGGAMFTLPAFDFVGQRGAQGRCGSFGRYKSRVSGLPEFTGELPVAALSEEILTPGEGQIKAMVTVAGNPVLSTPNGTQLEKAFEQLDFMVAIDIYLNETTKHADIILPPATGLESAHYDLIFNVLAVSNTAKYSKALFEKTAAQRHDWQIFKALIQRLTGQPEDGAEPEQILSFALKASAYSKAGLSLKKLKENPHGIDLGPLKPCLPQRLFTKDKRIQLAPELLCRDMKRLKVLLKNEKEKQQDFPLQLIGRRLLRSNNSWMHNAYRLVKGPNQCTLLIHPDDAEYCHIENGAVIQVCSAIGSIQIEAEISDEMMPGVVSIPHGFGHSRTGIQMEVAQAHAGSSINDLTDHRLIDELTGNAAFSGVPVKIEAI